MLCLDHIVYFLLMHFTRDYEVTQAIQALAQAAESVVSHSGTNYACEVCDSEVRRKKRRPELILRSGKP